MIRRNKIQNILIYIIMIVMLFYPTSKNSTIFEAREILIYSLISSILIFLNLIINKIDVKSIIITFITIIFLAFSTFQSIKILNAEFSIARFFPVVVLLVLLSTTFNTYKSNKKSMLRLLEIISIIIVLFNIIFLSGSDYIKEFIINNYSQFNFYTVSSSLELGKPIFTFGVHTYASFYYFIFFLLWIITIKENKEVKLRLYIYPISFIIFTLLLKSTSSFIFVFLMLLLLSQVFKKRKIKVYYLTALTFLFLSIMILELSNVNLFLIFSDERHGFVPRYFSENIFSENFKVLKKNIFGIGFTIPRNYNIVYTDSGYIVYLTMGFVFLPLIIYTLLWFFLKRNLKKYNTLVFFTIMIFEFAIPSLFYLKTVLLLIFIIGFIKEAESKGELYET